jgi:ACR3 family arsenite efflux pump ArsB
MIQKQLNFNQIESIKQNDVVKRLFFAFVSFWAIIKLIATLFVIFILTHLFRVFSQRVSDIVDEKKVLLF